MRTASLQRVRRAPLGASSPCFSLWEPFVPRLHVGTLRPRREFMCELVFALGEPAAHFLTCSACAFSNIYVCNLQEVSFASVSLSLYISPCMHTSFHCACMLVYLGPMYQLDNYQVCVMQGRCTICR